ncbi:chaperonin 10-like protein [Yarrowia lipolytica]|jgi:NADPH:quinone reductase-like Zn-dependent oxidoreductase|uniref:YALI0F25003p n=2 Tax=Yarrowia lipolytica TaxID=4952 RepID=Q6C0G2_YARLI|nr:YALI0F25003p [Yarrowia lipolytica CLIB122]AOW07669.1 hypothetical protein YALI1_F32330g [Yarrowia lipolytica]KAB8284480.1 chaperonin 10-like protein [Yarrowia lipolytica]KAE8174479.1 chaperonin 10-like protein [Yarrowia lipolytica]KAJ8055268.1 chaperonin 10-like protein [Yarrowia lipolytica]QNP99406.1 Protein AST2 [Yarrowia lipolytica]|eukprot:XP_505850.1 YALI0F25003p [Yarrowia lipolytica CLIB122]
METLANWLLPDTPKPLDIKQLTFGRPGGNKGFTFSTIPLPLKTNEVLIEVKAASLNPWDLKVWKQPQTWLKEEHGLGQDFSGIISDLGQGAASKGWKVGDRVCGLKLHYGSQGTIASHIVIDLNKTKYSMTHIPDNMTFEEAAAFPLVFGAAWEGLSHCPMQAIRDQTLNVCILGGGTAVGQMAIQLAKNHLRAKHVVCTTAGGESEEIARDLGADHVIDYKAAGNVGDAIEYIVGNQELDDTNDQHRVRFANSYSTNGEKFDVILDCAGGAGAGDVLAKAKSLLKPYNEGSAFVTLVGDYNTPKVNASVVHGSNGPSPLISKSISTYDSASYWYGGWTHKLAFQTGSSGFRYITANVKGSGDWINQAHAGFASNSIKVRIDTVYPWTKYDDAFEQLLSRKVKGKIVLRIQDF